MWRATLWRTACRTHPSGFRPLRLFPGAHVLSREYHIYHYTSPEFCEAIRKSGVLIPGNGHQGKGFYFTLMHREKGFSNEEVKIAVRHQNLPDEKIAKIVVVDTDDLDSRKITYIKKGNTVFIPSDTALDLTGIAAYQDNI